MYLDAAVPPVILTGSSGIIKPQPAGRKKLTKAQSRNDTDQPSPSRLTLGRPHTATPYSQPASLSPPSQPRPRSSSNILSRPPSLKKKKSMSFVSLFFNRNTQPSKSNTGSSFIDIEEKQTNLFKRSKTAIETGTPPSVPRTHRLSRSFSSTPNCHSKANSSSGQESSYSRPSFTPSPLGATPSPTMMRRFEHASKRSSESCTNIPRTKSPSSAFRQGVHGKGGPSAALPTVEVVDADAFYFDDDACSTISSICFADDPDDKPPNKGKCRESTIATDGPVTRLDRDSLVLDISASNRISVEFGDSTESEAREDNDISQTYRLPYRKRDKVLSILGEFPQQHQQTHQRRHSCSTASVSSVRSRWSTGYPPSVELSPAWALPDIPVVSPLTTTTFAPSLTAQPPTPTQSSLPPGSSSNPGDVKRKRRSTLVFPSANGLTAFLRPLETSDTKRFSRPFRSSTFSSTPSPPRFDLSVPPSSPARTPVPQSHPSAPPGLIPHVQSCDYAEQSTLDVESEGKKGKNRAYRDSIMTQDSTFSDLNRLPSSLLDDSLDSQDIPFDTAPSTPTLLSCVSPPSLSTSSESASTAQSPALSFANTPRILNPIITISSSNTPSPIGTSIPTYPLAPTPPLSISPPRSISPRRPPIRPLPQPPKPSIRLFPSLSPLNLPPTVSAGIELVIDPVDSPMEPAVSPIVFASSDSDDYSFERYPGDSSDDDSIEIRSWGSQDGIEPLLERKQVGIKERGERKAGAEAKQRQRMEENSGWSSVRVPLRKKSTGLVQERSKPATATSATHSHGRRETSNWVGEWNSDMHNVIQQLRTLR